MAAMSIITNKAPRSRKRHRRSLKRRNRNVVQKLSSANSTSMSPALNGVLIEDAHPHLWLTEDNLDLKFGELLGTLHGRRDLQEIAIYNVLVRFSCQEMEFLYDTIAQLPLLQSFTVWSSQCLSIRVVTNALLKAKGLKTVSFSNLQISSPQDVLQIAQAIQQHPSLTKLSLDNVRIRQHEQEQTTTISLDPLLLAIAQNPRIESVRISACNDEGEDGIALCMMTRPTQSLAALCSHPTLKSLSLWNMELPDEAVQTMATVLSHTPHTRLQTLSLRNCGPTLTHKGTTALAAMLHRNCQIQELHLDCLNSTSNDRTTDTTGGLQWQIEFLCRLNKSGTRRVLMEHHSQSSVWLDALAHHGNDLNTLYHLLGDCGGSTVLLPPA